MDFETIALNLRSDAYRGPSEFGRDMRLIFNNSRAYNTNKRSKVLNDTFYERYKIFDSTFHKKYKVFNNTLYERYN